MKKFIGATIMLTIIAFTACAGKTGENNQDENKKTEVKKMGTIHLTKAEFMAKVANYEANPTEWKYLGDKPCIIDFYADWCAPCKTIAPILEDLAKEYDGKVIIGKMDVDENVDTPTEFGIRNIPTILFFKDGQLVDKQVGAAQKSALAAKIEALL